MENERILPAKKRYGKIGWIYLAGSLLFLGVQLGAQTLMRMFFPTLAAGASLMLVFSMLPMYAVIVPYFCLLLRPVPASPPERHPLTAGQFFTALLMCYALMYAGNWAGQLITTSLGALRGTPVQNPLLNVVLDLNPWIAFLVTVLLAPLVEELIFRKLLVDRTVPFGQKRAVLLSGLMFGLFHGNLNQFAYAFPLGLFFAFLYVKTGRLRYPILLHMIINFMGSVAGLLMMKYSGILSFLEMLDQPVLAMESLMGRLPQLLVFFCYSVVLLAAAAAGIVLLIVNRKSFTLDAGGDPLCYTGRNPLLLASAGMFLYCLFWTVLIFFQLFY